MKLKKLYSATEAAVFLGLKHRTEFFPIKHKHNLVPVERIGNVWLYAVGDLKKLRKLLQSV